MRDMRASFLPWLATVLLWSACESTNKPVDLGVDLSVASIDIGADECAAAGGTCVAPGADCESAGMQGTVVSLSGCPSLCCVPAPLCNFSSCDGGVLCGCPVPDAECDLPGRGLCVCAPAAPPTDGGSPGFWSCPVL
jgi:hypothetical protein